jgi:hypothetical protein
MFIKSADNLYFASGIVACYMENCHSDSEIMSRNEALDDRYHTDEVEAQLVSLCRTRSESDGETESETD